MLRHPKNFADLAKWYEKPHPANNPPVVPIQQNQQLNIQVNPNNTIQQKLPISKHPDVDVLEVTRSNLVY